MTKEEFEAIESVNEYLMDMAVSLSLQNTQLFEKCFVRKEIPVEDYRLQREVYLFFQNSFIKYGKYYGEVSRKYYGLFND